MEVLLVKHTLLQGEPVWVKAVEDDPRNELYKYYVQFLDRYKPKMFVFENVLGIITAKRGEPLQDLKKLVDELGYDMEARVQIASAWCTSEATTVIIVDG